MRASAKDVSDFLQLVLRVRNLEQVSAVEASAWLDSAGVLSDRKERPGLPLRRLLREGRIAGARRDESKRWWIYNERERANRPHGALPPKRARNLHGSWQPIAVTFETTAQRHSDGQFSVPKRVSSLLGLCSEDDVALIVETEVGIFCATKKLASGLEIYGKDVAAVVSAGQRIRVTAMKPGSK